MAADIGPESEELAADLSDAGHRPAAEEIRDAIAGGATSTEILTRLGAALQDLQRSREIDFRLKRRARELRREIDRTLKRI